MLLADQFLERLRPIAPGDDDIGVRRAPGASAGSGFAAVEDIKGLGIRDWDRSWASRLGGRRSNPSSLISDPSLSRPPMRGPPHLEVTAYGC